MYIIPYDIYFLITISNMTESLYRLFNCNSEKVNNSMSLNIALE